MCPSPLLLRRAAAQTLANLSAHLHRLPTPPLYLRQMRLMHGQGAGIRCCMRQSPGWGAAAGWQMMLPAQSGSSSAQTVGDHALVNGRTRKRSAAGGWSEAEVCAEELAAALERLLQRRRPRHGRGCRSAWTAARKRQSCAGDYGLMPLRRSRCDRSTIGKPAELCW